jgi:hypothetical protein
MVSFSGVIRYLEKPEISMEVIIQIILFLTSGTTRVYARSNNSYLINLVVDEGD